MTGRQNRQTSATIQEVCADPVETGIPGLGGVGPCFEPPTRGGPSRTVVQRIVIPPGFETGWHYHPADVLVTVVRGSLTHYDAIGRVDVRPAGTSFLEPAGMIHAHLGRNDGDEPVVMYVTHVSPVSGALALPLPVAAPGDGAQGPAAA
ncbi:cupin domain-containing protein [Streptomyces sp. NPDC004667]|uniref:cupin domain-containing protein n=1 Tax=Streptomyces sp. NPDC004667 TaxID=3154285 RepID=UPI0033A80DB0